MDEIFVFYSWQTYEAKFNRNFIERLLKKSIKIANNEKSAFPKINLDQATRGVPGSPDIAGTIFNKIDKCSYFIADITLTENKIPNPNVLIELGYASSRLGWDNILLLFNEHFGKIENLPFDIRGRRVHKFLNFEDSNKNNIESENLQRIFTTIFFDLRKRIDPIENHPITKIFTFLNNRIVSTLNNWRHLIREMYRSAGIEYSDKERIKKNDIRRVCLAINPNERVGTILSFEEGVMDFESWLSFLKHKANKVHSGIFQILHFYSILDYEMIGYLSEIATLLDDDLLKMVHFKQIGNTDFEFIHNTIYEIDCRLSNMNDLFQKKYSYHKRTAMNQFKQRGNTDKL